MLSDASAWRHAHQLSGIVHMAVPGNDFLETDLVTDNPLVHPALHTDPNLVNPWGVAYAPNGPFWINDNGMGVVTIYDGDGNSLKVLGNHAIPVAPPMGGSTSAPTGEVFNPFGGFNVSHGGQTGSSLFLFATEDGTISGWSPNVDGGADTVLAVDNSKTVNAFGTGEVYKGLAIGRVHGDSFLFASDFRDGRVEVYNDQFQPVKSFTDPNVPKGYAPFNVEVLDHHLFVTFAVRNATGHDDAAGPGHGFVDEFDLHGNFVARVASHGPLDSPWGLAIAPKGFGQFAGDLLVGNFGNGEIHAYDLHTDKLVGTLRDAAGHPIHIDGLWSLIPGNSGAGGHPGSIYFTAGTNGESDGLFGRLTFHHDLHM
jgi:uncharacterized protein (TIGR03118 family)